MSCVFCRSSASLRQVFMSTLIHCTVLYLFHYMVCWLTLLLSGYDLLLSVRQMLYIVAYWIFYVVNFNFSVFLEGSTVHYSHCFMLPCSFFSVWVYCRRVCMSVLPSCVAVEETSSVMAILCHLHLFSCHVACRSPATLDSSWLYVCRCAET